MKNKPNRKIEEVLNGIRFSELEKSERDATWQNIADKIGHKPILSPWNLTATKRRTMINAIIAIMLVAGVGGTTVAADNSRPGDTLFPIDRAVESVRIAFAANAEAKAELKAKFANERLKEVKELAAESKTSTSTDVALGVNTAIRFLNKVSADLGATSTATSSASIKARAEIRDVVKRLEAFVNSDADVKARVRSDENFQLRIRGDANESIKINTAGNKTRIEVREEGERIRIEIKDAMPLQSGRDQEVRIKTNVDLDANATTSGTSTEASGKGKFKGLLELDLR